MSVAITVGLLTAAAVYLFMQRGMIRIVLGFVLISHAANLLLFAAGNTAFRDLPYIGSGEPGQQADPLPQAFVLTAIVIAFSITMFMVTLAITTTGDDDTETPENSPATVLANEGDDGQADTPGGPVSAVDSDGFSGTATDTSTAGAAGAGAGGADAPQLGPVHDAEAAHQSKRGGDHD